MEEFEINSHEMIQRRVKKPQEIGDGKWEWEVGDPMGNQMFNPENDLIAPSA